VQAKFERAVALLQNFDYPETVKAFQAVIKDDPDCAIAYCGTRVFIGSSLDLVNWWRWVATRLVTFFRLTMAACWTIRETEPRAGCVRLEGSRSPRRRQGPRRQR
jgi:hypothetical protein